MESFVFDSYHIDSTKSVLSFVYKLGFERFEEKLYLPKPLSASFDKHLLKQLLFSLHIAMGISYWKMRCCPIIEIKSGELSPEQAQFWQLIYTKGLGEFFYRNKIDFRGLLTFPSTALASVPSPVEMILKKRQLVGIGGGKDSVVSWEQLKKDGAVAQGLIIETQKKYTVLNELLEVGKIPAIRIRREMDEKVIVGKSNSAYRNGHVPISMIYAWIGVFAALVYDFEAFVVSNEASADEGNTEYLGMKINHQWSKTEEFELAFSTYIRAFISPSVAYYSPLRQMTELQIVKSLMQYPQYLPVVSSCNRNFSLTKPLHGVRWCGECAKCAFAFLLFAAYLKKTEVIQMFGVNMLEDKKLVGMFLDIIGRGNMKPFDCVGTFEESREAMRMIEERDEFEIPSEITV